jgi:transcriptional regulator with XRE-family HTH domain
MFAFTSMSARGVVLETLQRAGDLGLSQRDVAERMGTSNTAISRIESGRHPTKQDTLARLAEALEMRYVHGFEIDGGKSTPVRELVSV